MKIGYASGFKTDASTLATATVLRQNGCATIYTDAPPPKKGAIHPGLRQALHHITTNHTLVVPALNQLAHGIPDLCIVLQRLHGVRAFIHSLEYGPDTPPLEPLHLIALARAFSSFPRRRHPPRPRTKPRSGPHYKLSPEQIAHAELQIKAGAHRKDIAAQLGVCDATLARGISRLRRQRQAKLLNPQQQDAPP